MTEGPDVTGAHQTVFYVEDPSDYFRDRLSLLALRAGAASGLAVLAADGVTWGPIRLGGTSLDGPGTEDDRLLSAYVITESQNLLREVSRALIIHFLAHSTPAADPWSEAPRLVQSREWLDLLPALAREPPDLAVLDRVAEVFLGGVRVEPSATWLAARDTSARLVQIIARRWLAEEQPAAYGVLGLPGTSGPGSDEAVASAHDRAWLTHLTLNQLRVLWKVARLRHLGQPHDGLDLVTPAALDALAHS